MIETTIGNVKVIFCDDVPDRDGRVYSKEAIQKAIDEMPESMKQRFVADANRAFEYDGDAKVGISIEKRV